MIAAVRALPTSAKVWVLVGVTALVLAVALFAPPQPQSLKYHLFADQRSLWGIPNFGDTVSNVGFLIVGLAGLWHLKGARGEVLFEMPGERWPYLVFFAGVALVAVGSAYYHASIENVLEFDWCTNSSTKSKPPEDLTPLRRFNEPLVWDRLPMTVAFMALFAAFIADRVRPPINVPFILPLLLIVGAGSVVLWALVDDLRLYGVVKFYPVVGIVLICLLFPGRLTNFKLAGYAFLWFGLATIFEGLDEEIFCFLDKMVSGHTLKHLAAAMATYMVLRMLRAAPFDAAPQASD